MSHIHKQTEIRANEHRDTGEGNTQQSLSSRSYGEENNNHAECCTENNLPLSVKKNNKEQNVVFRRRQRPMCTSLELRWSM